MRCVLLALALAMACPIAWAQSGMPVEYLLQNRTFLPRFYPAEALDRTIGGRAQIRCAVSEKDRISDCVIISESPFGMGFGGAALKRLKVARDVKAVGFTGERDGDHIVFSLNFEPPEKDGGRRAIEDLTWAHAPTFDDMAASWPANAGKLSGGSAVLRCRVGSRAELADCRVAGQIPKGSAFGEAALQLVAKFRLADRSAAAVPPDCDVLVSFHFFDPASPMAQARTVTKPDWIDQINAGLAYAVYPPQAADADVQAGLGVADCLVGPEGALTDCRVGRASPEGFGFGEAAVRVVSVMHMDIWTPEGRPTAGARVKVPVQFRLAPLRGAASVP